MKAYKDLFGKKLNKQDVTQAVIHTVRTGKVSSFHLTRSMGIGFFKASRLIKLLADANVVTAEQDNRRVLLNEDAALNAAFRQLKKGNR